MIQPVRQGVDLKWVLWVEDATPFVPMVPVCVEEELETRFGCMAVCLHPTPMVLFKIFRH
jgi:hypothetical protein